MSLFEIKFQRFIRAQVKYISDAKYFEGINTHHDPGEEFVEVFIREKSVVFRNCWDKSQCCNCSRECGDLLKEHCDNFKQLEDIDESKQSNGNS